MDTEKILLIEQFLGPFTQCDHTLRFVHLKLQRACDSLRSKLRSAETGLEPTTIRSMRKILTTKLSCPGTYGCASSIHKSMLKPLKVGALSLVFSKLGIGYAFQFIAHLIGTCHAPSFADIEARFLIVLQCALRSTRVENNIRLRGSLGTPVVFRGFATRCQGFFHCYFI